MTDQERKDSANAARRDTALFEDGSDIPQQVNITPEVDAFSPEAAPGLSFIVLMRIYDVLMTDLRYKHGETISNNLLELHARGALLNPPPYFSGEFLYSAANAPSEEAIEAADQDPQLNLGVDDEPLSHDSVSDKGLA